MSAPVPVPVSLSIFDIALIIDTICQGLSLYDIQACRRVNKHWSILFKPHLWCIAKISSSKASSFYDAALFNDTIATLLANKHLICSLHLNSQHLKQISESGIFTTLQELVLYDNTDSKPHYMCLIRQAAVALIHNNKHLQRLTIDLDSDHYRDDNAFSLAIMLAIARHRSLTQFTWRVPKSHESAAFAKSLLYACHSGSIQELVVAHRYYYSHDDYIYDYIYDDIYYDRCCCCGRYYYDYCVTFKDTDYSMPLDLKNDPYYVEFKNKLEVPIDQLEEPFALRRLCLPSSDAYEPYLLPLLGACPDLQSTHVDMASEHSSTILEMLARRPHLLRGLGLDCTSPDKDYAREIGRFTRLQRLHIPAMSRDQVGRVIDVLATSEGRRRSLEVLEVGMKAVSAEDVVSILATFPNLKELRIESFRIYIREVEGGAGGALEYEEQSLKEKDLDFSTVVRDWDAEQINRPQGNMVDWWSSWSRALRLMRSIQEEHSRYQQGLAAAARFCHGQSRSFSMRFMFMYPIRPFMSYRERCEYVQATGPRPKHARGFTIMDAYRLVRGIKEYAEERKAARREDLSYLSYWYSGRWNEYDQREDQSWGTPDTAQEYTIAKSRNRHRSLRDRKRSAFRRPFKK